MQPSLKLPAITNEGTEEPAEQTRTTKTNSSGQKIKELRAKIVEQKQQLGIYRGSQNYLGEYHDYLDKAGVEVECRVCQGKANTSDNKHNLQCLEEQLRFLTMKTTQKSMEDRKEKASSSKRNKGNSAGEGVAAAVAVAMAVTQAMAGGTNKKKKKEKQSKSKEKKKAQNKKSAKKKKASTTSSSSDSSNTSSSS